METSSFAGDFTGDGDLDLDLDRDHDGVREREIRARDLKRSLEGVLLGVREPDVLDLDLRGDGDLERDLLGPGIFGILYPNQSRFKIT